MVSVTVKGSKMHFCSQCCINTAGEICRYLLAQPVIPEESHHKIRLMWGSGLRPQIWKTFVKRFNIPAITELYGKLT